MGLSFLGSTHCLSMCGPLCLAFTKTKKAAAYYHVSRLFSYILLASMVYFLKEEIRQLGVFNSVSKYNGIFLFGFLILVSIFMLIGVKIKLPKLNIGIMKPITNFLNRNKLLGASSIGFLNGFIPCGWLYSFLLLVSFSGNYAQALIWTVAFWLPNALILSFGSIGLRNLPIKNKLVLTRALAVFILCFSSYKLFANVQKINKNTHQSHSEVPQCH